MADIYFYVAKHAPTHVCLKICRIFLTVVNKLKSNICENMCSSKSLFIKKCLFFCWYSGNPENFELQYIFTSEKFSVIVLFVIISVPFTLLLLWNANYLWLDLFLKIITTVFFCLLLATTVSQLALYLVVFPQCQSCCFVLVEFYSWFAILVSSESFSHTAPFQLIQMIFHNIVLSLIHFSLFLFHGDHVLSNSIKNTKNFIFSLFFLGQIIVEICFSTVFKNITFPVFGSILSQTPYSSCILLLLEQGDIQSIPVL